MPIAADDTYSAPSGATLYAGRFAPLPLWAQGKAVHEWFAITGTTHAGSPADPTDDPLDPFCRSTKRLAYSNIALAGSRVVIAATGGHNDYSGNEVTSIDLSVAEPDWVLNLARSAVVAEDVAYYSDGRPTSRHTYHAAQYSTTHSRLMLHRTRFSFGGLAVSFDDSNGFDLPANAWDPDNTWSDGYTALCRDADDNCWALNDTRTELYKWTAATDSWALTGSFGSAGPNYPMCHDSTRDLLFALCWGNGEASGSGVSAAKFTSGGTVRTAITFNASAALTQFEADAPSYASMEYDPINDRFLFWDGASGRLYAITPNAGTTWDMSIVATTGASVPAASYSFGRMKYVPSLRGCVVMPSGHQPLYFMRTF